MEKFKGMTFEQCKKFVEKMNPNERLEFFTVKIDAANFYNQEIYNHAYNSLPTLRIVHPWWSKIEMEAYGKEFYEYYN